MSVNRNVNQPTPIGSPRIFQFHKEDFLYELLITHQLLMPKFTD